MQNLDLSNKSKDELIELIKLADARKDHLKYNKIETFYPETGQYSRYNYPKLMELMSAGINHLIRGLFGANGSGKTTWGAFESYCHLTGKYPAWWTGRRYKGPITAWIVGREGKQARASIQKALFGDYTDQGTGMIPKKELLDDSGHLTTKSLPGTNDAIGTARVRHYDEDGNFDGWSTLEFKNASQGWQEFQGANIQWIWIDEEPDDPRVYSECLARTRGKKGQEGSLLLTFTPILGYTTIYLSFLPNGQLPPGGVNPNNRQKFAVVIDDNQPHLTDEWKESMLAEWKLTDPTSIKARKTGLASIGVGRIYPVDEDFVVVRNFMVPPHWPRLFGMDFGYTAPTACVWIAKDPLTKTCYVYDEYKIAKQIPSIHAMMIKSRGEYMTGLCDPAKGGRNADGSLTMDLYKKEGLRLIPSDNGLKSGIARILNAFEVGQLKIMDNCTNLLQELRMYRYDDKTPDTPARDQNDHELDALRYGYVDPRFFDYYAVSQQEYEERLDPDEEESRYFRRRPRGQNHITGY